MILRFLLSSLLCGRREQCGHCDQLTISKMPIKSQKHIKMFLFYTFYVKNVKFIEEIFTY